MSIYVCVNIYKYVYIHPYLFASIFRKWKLFHQCLSIPQSGKDRIIFFNFSVYLASFRETGKHFIVAIYFHEMQNESNFLYFFIYISFHYWEVDYILPMRFISTRRKIFHQRTVFH